MSKNFEDNSVNNLLKDIDDLMNRIGDRQQSQISDQYSQKEHLKQTGRFQSQKESENEMPKKFHTSVSQKKSATPKKKVQLPQESEPSSSSSEDEKYRKLKKTKSVQKFNKPLSLLKGESGSKISQCSYRQKVQQDLRFDSKSQLSQKQQEIVQPTRDAFCLLCEEFIPIDIVDIHTNQCREEKQKKDVDNSKLQNYQKLLQLRFQGSQDEELKNQIELLYNCTQSLIEAQDQYQISLIVEDLCMIKQSLMNNTKAYHILTVAQKIQEIANIRISQFSFAPKQREPILNIHQNRAQFQQADQDVENQTVISYATTKTLKKRLFEEPSKPILPKRLIQFNQSGNTVVHQQEAKPKKEQQSNTKQGIFYGNNYDSSKKREYIQLSSSKTHSRLQTVTQFHEDLIEPSVISKVQSYFSSAKDEEQKKRFFYMGCMIKDRYPLNHPAQNILISEMYDQCQRQQIPESEYSTWITNILSNA